MTWIIWPNDWGEWNLGQRVDQLLASYNDVVAQEANHSPDTLEWRQALDALGNEKDLYQKAINTYQDALNKMRASSAASKQGSVMKQQAKQWYIWWLATRRWMTHAEAMKDMADIEGAGRWERREIEATLQKGLGEWTIALSNLYANMGDKQADMQEAARVRAAASKGWGSSIQWYMNSPSGWVTNLGDPNWVIDGVWTWWDLTLTPRPPKQKWWLGTVFSAMYWRDWTISNIFKRK